MTSLKSAARSKRRKRGGTTRADDPRRLASTVKPLPRRRMSEREFLEWAGETMRAEWVEGEATVLPPDSKEHDELGNWVRSLFQLFAEHHGLGFVRGPNYAVRLPRQRQRRTPDVVFVAKERARFIRPTFLEGVPTLTLEIVSPESVARDWREKYFAYQRSGVREYWVIDRNNSRLEGVARGTSGRYERIVEDEGRLESTVLKGLYLRPEWVLGPKLPRVRTVLKQLGVEDKPNVNPAKSRKGERGSGRRGGAR